MNLFIENFKLGFITDLTACVITLILMFDFVSLSNDLQTFSAISKTFIFLRLLKVFRSGCDTVSSIGKSYVLLLGILSGEEEGKHKC